MNRQALHNDVNPLFKKFVNEGDNPSTYIPATKRREIYDYMSQVHFTKHLESMQLHYFFLSKSVFIPLIYAPFVLCLIMCR